VYRAAEPRASPADLSAAETEVAMKRLMISAFAAVALLAAATTMLQSQAPAMNRAFATTGMMPLQEIYAAADVNKLPIEEFEDQSLVFSTASKH
jgi:hypothetical protein